LAKLFYLLSGEHENLPFSELRAILEAEGFAYEVLEKLDQVARLEVDPACVEVIIHRAALTRICALELANCRANMVDIVKAATSMRLDEFLSKEASFAVRVRRVRNSATSIDIMTIERTLGDLILSKAEGVRVSLRKPDKTFFGILTGDRFVFGIKLGEISAKPFVERRPRKKPFFHPSAMQAKLARCMVNLAKPQIDDLIMDPFCGTGSNRSFPDRVSCAGLGCTTTHDKRCS
jgi:tRNA (guanine10-N2)-dimethyltransferase